MNPVKDIGFCGVDSAQILAIDPQILVGNWEEEEYKDIRRYKHKDGTILQYMVDFPNYEAIIPKYSKTMNQINADGEAEELPAPPAEKTLSYYSCCRATLDGFAGVLGKGIGAVTRTGVGDGSYSVFPVEKKEGEKVGVQIVFTEDFDLLNCLEDCIGEINNQSGKILLTDPCYIGSQGNLDRGNLALAMRYASEDGHTQLNYDIGHEGLGVMIALPKGEYDVYVEIGEVDGWGERVKGMAIIPKSE